MPLRYNHYIRWRYYKFRTCGPYLDKELTQWIGILQYQLRDNDIISLRICDEGDRIGYFINNKFMFFFEMIWKYKYYYIMSIDWGRNIGN